MRARKKILFIIPSLVGGGAEKALLNLLQHLDRKKYDIDLLVVEKKGIYLDQVPDYVNVSYMFTSKYYRNLIIELHRRFNISWPFKKLTRKIISSHYDVGISFLDSVYSDMLLFMEDKIAKSALVLHSSYKSNSNKYKFIKGHYKQRLSERYRKVDTIIGVSNDVIEEFAAILGTYEDMRIITNPIPQDDILVKSKAFDPRFSNDVVNIVAVGSLLPVKGYDNLIAACKLLKASRRDFKLRILGKGPLEEQLKYQIHNSGLDDYISLLGFQRNPYPYMLHSDVFVMSSHAEGLPTVLCEAMILGKPVVVTDCSGCRGLVSKGTYGLMTENNPRALCEGLKGMIDDPEKRRHYSQKAKERSKKFNVEHAVMEYEKVLKCKSRV